MMKIIKQINLFVVLICILFLLSACSSVCENRIITVVSSPDKKVKAVLFERSAGATTGTNFQLSIIDINEDLPNKAGNVLICDKTNSVQISWKNDNHLVVMLNLENTRFFKKNSTHEKARFYELFFILLSFYLLHVW